MITHFLCYPSLIHFILLGSKRNTGCDQARPEGEHRPTPDMTSKLLELLRRSEALSRVDLTLLCI